MMTIIYRKYFIYKEDRIDPLGIDFNRNGIYELDSSSLRFVSSKIYALIKNSKILN